MIFLHKEGSSLFFVDVFSCKCYNYNVEVIIMIKYKINVLESLKEAGYNTGRLRTEKLLGENAIQSFRSFHHAVMIV